MLTFIFTLFSLSLLIMVYVFKNRKKRAPLESGPTITPSADLKRIANRSNLNSIDCDGSGGVLLRGVVDHLSVQITATAVSIKTTPPAIFYGGLCKENHNEMKARRYQTGDDEFDRMYFYNGLSETGLIFLDWDTRREIRRTGLQKLTRDNLIVAYSDYLNSKQLSDSIKLARHFSQDPKMVAMHNLAETDLSFIRLNIAYIAKHYPDDVEIGQMLVKKGVGHYRQLWSLVAPILGVRQIDFLEARIRERDVTDAVEVLLTLQEPAAREILIRLLRGTAVLLSTRELVVIGLGKRKDFDALAMVLDMTASYDRGQLDSAALSYLSDVGGFDRQSKRACKFLLSLTEREELRHGAIKALIHWGDIKAIEPLTNLLAGKLLKDLDSLVKKTINAIQARLGQVDRGWLSLEQESSKSGGLSSS